jgi:hypothetical protein
MAKADTSQVARFQTTVNEARTIEVQDPSIRALKPLYAAPLSSEVSKYAHFLVAHAAQSHQRFVNVFA